MTAPPSPEPALSPGDVLWMSPRRSGRRNLLFTLAAFFITLLLGLIVVGIQGEGRFELAVLSAVLTTLVVGGFLAAGAANRRRRFGGVGLTADAVFLTGLELPLPSIVRAELSIRAWAAKYYSQHTLALALIDGEGIRAEIHLASVAGLQVRPQLDGEQRAALRAALSRTAIPLELAHQRPWREVGVFEARRTPVGRMIAEEIIDHLGRPAAELVGTLR